jgi:HEAT repeat protein
MDPLPLLLIVAFLGGTAIFDAMRRHDGRKRKGLLQVLRQAARECGLTDVRREARLQDLLMLVREFPEHNATRRALRAALKDKDEDIRLRCAIALAEEGRETLRQLAHDRGTSDDGAARAIAALREHFPLAQARKLLTHALRKRRVSVAAAVLDALALRRAPEAVETIADVLRRDEGELAVAAAQALAVSGLPDAEPPLLQALGRDQPGVCLAAARALGRVGTVAAVPSLKDAIARRDDGSFARAARQAIAEIQSRIQGATPGQLSLADAQSHPAGQLTLADDDTGRLSLTDPKADAR